MEKFLRLPEVESAVGLRRSALYKLIAAGRFPRPIKLSPRVSVWRSSQVAAWIAAAIERRALPAATDHAAATDHTVAGEHAGTA